MGPAVDPDHGAALEPAQPQGVEVEVGGPRVAGVEHLEAAVDDEPVDPLGGQPAAGVAARLEHVDVDARRRPAGWPRTGPASPAPDDDDLGARTTSCRR